jgi:hypothetical protein
MSDHDDPQTGDGEAGPPQANAAAMVENPLFALRRAVSLAQNQDPEKFGGFDADVNEAHVADPVVDDQPSGLWLLSSPDGPLNTPHPALLPYLKYHSNRGSVEVVGTQPPPHRGGSGGPHPHGSMPTVPPAMQVSPAPHSTSVLWMGAGAGGKEWCGGGGVWPGTDLTKSQHAASQPSLFEGLAAEVFSLRTGRSLPCTSNPTNCRVFLSEFRNFVPLRIGRRR